MPIMVPSKRTAPDHCAATTGPPDLGAKFLRSLPPSFGHQADEDGWQVQERHRLMSNASLTTRFLAGVPVPRNLTMTVGGGLLSELGNFENLAQEKRCPD